MLNLLFPGLHFQFAFFRAGKKQNGSDFQFGFFPGLEKASQARLRLPICFFPAREKAKLFQISNLLFPNPGKSNRKSEEQLFLQRGQVTNMTCADLSQDLREPFATAVRAHSKSAFEIRSLTRKRWVFERRRRCRCPGSSGSRNGWLRLCFLYFTVVQKKSKIECSEWHALDKLAQSTSRITPERCAGLVLALSPIP